MREGRQGRRLEGRGKQVSWWFLADLNYCSECSKFESQDARCTSASQSSGLWSPLDGQADRETDRWWSSPQWRHPPRELVSSSRLGNTLYVAHVEWSQIKRRNRRRRSWIIIINNYNYHVSCPSRWLSQTVDSPHSTHLDSSCFLLHWPEFPKVHLIKFTY